MSSTVLISRLNVCRCVTRSYTYKSVYHPDNLFPNSVGAFSRSSFFAKSNDNKNDDVEKFTGPIPIKKLTFNYSRSSGPGGQHVNTTNSKAEARFQIMTADWLPQDTKEQLFKKFRKQISRNGEIIVSCDESRYQMNNVKSCIEKIQNMIEVAQTPEEEKEEVTYSMDQVHRFHEKRLRKKKMRSTTKAMRNNFDFDS
uniref:Large ribosomal subunit protein mL62 n=1 Tax=Phallusia mammillata TaxID=59560 RepID=A0A6F9DLT6_9ASCI|nr:peptidyl-tRNA hydrolase ICT1, mitochondrial [Phallusia mammillata]